MGGVFNFFCVFCVGYLLCGGIFYVFYFMVWTYFCEEYEHVNMYSFFNFEDMSIVRHNVDCAYYTHTMCR